MKGITISTANEIEIVDIPENGQPLYELARDLVGGFVEITHPKGLNEDYIMIVNESGILLDLPMNPFASHLYGFDEHGYPIVGNALILKQGFFGGEPDTVGIPDEEAEELFVQLGEAMVKRFGTSVSPQDKGGQND